MIFDPLNIPEIGGPSTAQGSLDEQEAGEAFYNAHAPRAIAGWWDPEQRLIVNPYGTNFELDLGAGSWRMSAVHMARFLAGFFSDSVVSRDTRGQMWERPPAGDGWGRGWLVNWQLSLSPGRRSPWVLNSASFGGNMSGTRSTIAYWPADDVAIAMVSTVWPQSGPGSVMSIPFLRSRLTRFLGSQFPSYDLFSSTYGLPSLD